MEKTFGPSQNDARRSPARGPKIIFTKKFNTPSQAKLPLHSLKGGAGTARNVCADLHVSLEREGVDGETVQMARKLKVELDAVFKYAREELGGQSFNETTKHVFLARVLLIELSEMIEKIGLAGLQVHNGLTVGENVSTLKMFVEPMQDKLREAYSAEATVEICKFDVGVTLGEISDKANRIWMERSLKSRASVVGIGRLEVVQAENTILEIIDNLLWNASKYSDRIEITYGSGLEHATIIVSDWGSGVPIGYEHMLFVEGAKLKNATKDSTGIGLSASKRAAVEMLGGGILYGGPVNEEISQNARGRGAIFTLYFPIESPYIKDIQI